MKIVYIISLLFTLFYPILSSPKVITRFGELRGFLTEPFEGQRAEVFLNIPYALPPVGNLRFEKPQLYNQTWTNGRDALKFGPGCVPLINDPEVPVDEDCLTLNILRPHKRKSDELLPVLVYVHGGGYAFGSSFIYGYDQLARNYVSRNLILITTQYRLGFFGFSSLGFNSTYPSNLGLFDQAMAFKWIHENIKSFGGDPNKITAKGLSAGSAIVGLLALSPYSRDYLSKTIEMSGSSNAVWAVSDETIHYTRKFAHFIGCPVEGFKECIHLKPTAFVLEMTTKFTSPTPKFLQFTPVLDGDFFPKSLDKLILEAPKIPSLIGITQLESSYFVILNKDLPINSLAVPPHKQLEYGYSDISQYVRNFTNWFGYNNKPVIERELIKFYSRNESSEPYFYLRKFNELTSDFFFTVPSLNLAKTRSAVGWPTYFYLNSYFNPKQFKSETPCQASTHSNEYPYMNGLFPIDEFEFNHNDKQFQDLLNTVLAEFVKNGIPSPEWPQIKSDSINYGHFTEEAILSFYNRHSPIQEVFDFWSNLDRTEKENYRTEL